MTNERTFDPAIQTEELGFAPDELLECSSCGRRNAPDRGKCIYCGNAISSIVSSAIDKTSPEAWEAGFNVIVTGGPGSADERSNEIIDSGLALPYLRLADENSARNVTTELSEKGIDATVISDAELDLDRTPVRLSAIEMNDNEFIFVSLNTGETKIVMPNELKLIVKGVLISSRSDILEKRKRRADAKVIDDTFADSIEPVLDLYIADDPCGFRVSSPGFDFSCLGDRKKIMATENIEILAETLRSASSARLIDNYRSVRPMIDMIWPMESRRETHGIQRAGFGQLGFARTESTNNQVQFNRFSRLQFHCL